MNRMKYARPFHRILLLAVIGAILSYATPVFPLTLKEAVSTAVRSNPEVLAAQKNFHAMEERLAQVRGGYWPTLDMTAGYGKETSNHASTRRTGASNVKLNRSEFGLSLNQNLFHGFRNRNEIKHAQARLQSADWEYRNVAESLALDAVEIYLHVLKRRKLLELIEKHIELQQDILEKIRQLHKKRYGTIAEVRHTESRLALKASDLESSRGVLQDA